MAGMLGLCAPAWSQSAVWQPPGAVSGSIYYNGGNVGIGTSSPFYPLTVSTGPDRILNFRGDPLVMGLPADFRGPIIQAVNGTQTAIAPLTLAGSSVHLFGSVGIGTTNAPFPLTVHAGTDRVLNLRGDPATFGLPSTLTGPILQSVNSAQTAFTPMTLYTSATYLLGGNVGIGTVTPQYKLAVNGTIGAKDVMVTSTGWPDYVFKPGYRLRPLSEVGAYIREHGHLPEVPSEAEVKEKGVSVAEIQAKLLAKIEELTLHLIQQEKDNHDMRERLARLEKDGGAVR
jgi:ribosomal protein S15P/S13E